MNFCYRKLHFVRSIVINPVIIWIWSNYESWKILCLLYVHVIFIPTKYLHHYVFETLKYLRQYSTRLTLMNFTKSLDVKRTSHFVKCIVNQPCFIWNNFIYEFEHLHVYFQYIQRVAMLKTFNLMLCRTKVGMIMLLTNLLHILT